MESPRPIDDDEVIADSEEEGEQGNFYPESGSGGIPRLNGTSSVSAFTATANHPPARELSGISAFTGDPEDYHSHYPSLLNGVAGNRNGKVTDTPVTSTTAAFTDFEGISGSVSIADRAKMRQRTQKPAAVSDFIEITSDEDDDELGLKPSTSKAKIKPKPKPKAKEKFTEMLKASNVGDPLESTSNSRPRPRPRPIPKRPKITHVGIGIVPVSGPPLHAAKPRTSTPPPPSHDPEIPIATSTPPMPMAQPRWQQTNFLNNPHTLTSQLPPSDPPIPSLSTAYNEYQYDQGLPRIETLPDVGQPSSPSSLFSDPERPTKKRKRTTPDEEPYPEVDELATSQGAPGNLDFPGRLDYLSPRDLGPPPTFFAGSSSSSMGGGRGNALPDHLLEHDVVDLTMLPLTIDPGAAKKAASAKSKKARKKKTAEEDEDMMPPPMIFLDQDEKDEDFDPTADGKPEKKKAKAKPKDKAPKNKSKSKSKSKDGSDLPRNLQVEVVITSKPSTKGKNKEKPSANTATKDKEKGGTKAGNKDVFKSREFIQDSDDEADPMGLVGGVNVDEISTTSVVASIHKDNAETTASTSAPSLKITLPATSSTAAVAVGSACDSRTKPTTKAPSFSNSNLDSDMPKTSSSTSKRRSGGNKRKAIFDSDDEEDEDVPPVGEDEIYVSHSAPIAKKRKTGDHGTKDKGKARSKVVLSDVEQEDEPDIVDAESATKDIGKKKEKAHRETKKTKALKKITRNEDEDDIGDAHVDVQEPQPTPEEIHESAKENIVPPPSKIGSATPKPPTIPKLLATNRDGSTPIYARYEIAPRKSSLPMSELIRRANSNPGSPFATPHPTSSSSKLKPLVARTPTATAYSPYLKSSRSFLSRIAPLHPNRRTPPPPPPPPPPRKKTKKELEMEEKWEEEMVESVGGMEAWAVLPDEERKEMRKMKWAREMGGWDD
ncbi:hypothetical protein GALMADRAFT_137813 [Galerina marginata CBS 339.88]|uniref:Uncharacterized protein n=1 Tax=Galerina marginata (strain CBS 339.88) TaxID=685588 RepID=A0A067TFY1_GALM3|nr:hypothetical protein GALMADRAFT_137813 [Galerina marginata CBS 339.88]